MWNRLILIMKIFDELYKMLKQADINSQFQEGISYTAHQREVDDLHVVKT